MGPHPEGRRTIVDSGNQMGMQVNNELTTWHGVHSWPPAEPVAIDSTSAQSPASGSSAIASSSTA